VGDEYEGILQHTQREATIANLKKRGLRRTCINREPGEALVAQREKVKRTADS